MTASGASAPSAASANTAISRRLFPTAGWVGLLALVLLVSVAASVALGTVSIAPRALFRALTFSEDASAVHLTVVWDLRLPRVVLAALVGAALASAGVAFQALFRNALADPFVVGASSGASLGATLALTLGFSAGWAGLGPLPLAAFVGAVATVLCALALAESGAQSSVASLLLAGTALSTMLSALVSFLLLWANQPWFHAFNWLLGSFSGRDWSYVAVACPYLLACYVVLQLMARPLDALTAGDDVARSLGLSVRAARLVIIGAATMAASVAVAFSGVIGFVGLIAPHIGRLLFGASHRTLLPASAMLGAILLVWGDLAARTLLAPVEVPIGIVTAFLGGPFFLYLLKSRGGRLA